MAKFASKFCQQFDISYEERQSLRELPFELPCNEEKRIQTLRQCELFDTPPEDSYDRYVAICARRFKVHGVVLSLVDVDRAWFKARIGLEANEIPRKVSINGVLLLERTPRYIVVPDTLQDARFRDNALVLGPPFVRFYAGASVIVDGIKVATLCMIDTAARAANSFTYNDVSLLIEIADAISTMMAQRRKEMLAERFSNFSIYQNILTILKVPLHHLSTTFEESIVSQKASSLLSYDGSVHAFDKKLQIFTQFTEAVLRFLARSVMLPVAPFNTPVSSPRSSKYGNLQFEVVEEDHFQLNLAGMMIQFDHKSLLSMIDEVAKCLFCNCTKPCGCAMFHNDCVSSLVHEGHALQSHPDLLFVCFASLMHHLRQYLVVQGLASELIPNVQLVFEQQSSLLGIVLVQIPSEYAQHLCANYDLVSAIANTLHWVDGSFIVEEMMIGIWVPCQLLSSATRARGF